MPMPEPSPTSADRWPLLRDLIEFQIKVALNNVLNVFISPISLIAALLDLWQERGRFRRVLQLSRQLDETIDPYGVIGGYHATGAAGFGGLTADELARRVEDCIATEVRRGASAGQVQAAVDRLLAEQLRRRR